MFTLAAGETPSPLGHVLDKNIVGGPDALFMADPNGMPFITMHMITLVVAAVLCLWLMVTAARAIATGRDSMGNTRYVTRGRLAQIVEVLILALRDQMLRPLLGKPIADKYLPYLLTLFFFILLNNILGLVPLMDAQGIFGAIFNLGEGTEHSHGAHWSVVGGTATGNLAINAGLAVVAFLVIQLHGIKENGIGGWAHHFLGGAPVWLAPLMIPVELMGMVIKPCALTIRLFANMLAGHTLMATLMLFGLMAAEGGWAVAGGVSVVSGLFALFIYCLELFVAFLQAFVFMFLVAVFISQLSHHGDHDHEHEAHAEAATA